MFLNKSPAFSPVWIFIWIFKPYFRVNFVQQILHRCVLLPVWCMYGSTYECSNRFFEWILCHILCIGGIFRRYYSSYGSLMSAWEWIVFRKPRSGVFSARCEFACGSVNNFFDWFFSHRQYIELPARRGSSGVLKSLFCTKIGYRKFCNDVLFHPY